MPSSNYCARRYVEVVSETSDQSVGLKFHYAPRIVGSIQNDSNVVQFLNKFEALFWSVTF
jgi:hypothetical protein